MVESAAVPALPVTTEVPLRVRRIRQPLLTRPDGGLQVGLFPGPTWIVPNASAHDLLIADADPAGGAAAPDPAKAQQLFEELLGAGVLDKSHSDPDDLKVLSPAAHAALGAERDWLVAQSGAASASKILARRRRSAVEIRGGMRWAALLASLLAAAGIGRLRVVDADEATDADVFPGAIQATGDARGRTAAETAMAAGADVRLLGPEGDRDLVVLADGSDLDPATVDALMRTGTPHLVLAARAHHLQVGPLVVPTRTACLYCWAHSRTDDDPAWPTLTTQLAYTSCNAVAGAAVAIAAGLAAAAALAHLDAPGLIRPAEVAWLLNATDDPVRRRLNQHPMCGCSWYMQPAA